MDCFHQPYAALICGLDAEWSRAMGRGLSWDKTFRTTAQTFGEACRRFCEGIDENYRKLCEANRAEANEALGDEYFAPIHYWPLDRSDILSLALVDDLDAINHITSRLPNALENTCIGFCPGGAWLEPQGSPFVPLGHAIRRAHNAGDDRLPPLLVFARFKMDGLAVLGLGLAFQAALWKAIVRRSLQILQTLEKSGQSEASASTMTALGIEPMQLRRTVCSLLDLQGGEEVGLLIWTHNLSVAFSLVAGAAALAFGDVIAADPSVASLLDQSELHRRLLLEMPEDTGGFHRYPVFRWVHSQVAIRMLLDERSASLLDAEGISGRVWATSGLQLVPGQLGSCRQNFSSEDSTTSHGSRIPEKSCLRYGVGLYDRWLTHGKDALNERSGTPCALAGVVDNLVRFVNNQFAGQTRPGREVVEWETLLVVPVPCLQQDGRSLLVGDRAFPQAAPLLDVLPRMVAHLFQPPENSKSAQDVRPLDIVALSNALCRLGVPVSLRRSLQYLFHDFATLIRDPHCFDLVVDLYDVFASLHNLLTRHLPILPSLPVCAGTDGSHRRILDAERVERLASFSEALHNTLVHRTANAFRAHASRDLAADFRGGLNQILLAADAPLKCGMGILRHHAAPGSGFRLRNTVGCIMRIGMNPGARAAKIELGVENKVRLAFVDTDVPHALHIASYADYFHEAFHLIFEELLLDADFINKLRAAGAFDALQNEKRRDLTRLEDVFALMMTRLFIFGDDVDAYLYHNVLTFSRDTASIGASDADTIRRFSDVLARLFLAVDGVGCADDVAQDRQVPPSSSETNESLIARYIEHVQKLGPFFSEYQRLWRGASYEAVWEYSLYHFQIVHRRLRVFLPVLIDKARELHRRALDGALPGLTAKQQRALVMKMERQIDNALKSGSLLCWSAQRCDAQPKKGDTASRNQRGNIVDPYLFISSVLKCYIGRVKDAAGKNLHLRRNESGNLSFDHFEDAWTFQSDKGAAALFCCVPEARRKRLQRQITILKAFWDVSAELRGRRFLEMLIAMNDASLGPERRA